MNMPNTTMAANSAPIGIASASAARPMLPVWLEATVAPSDLAGDPFDQIIHLLQHGVGLHERGACRNDDFAGVVLERTFEDDVIALHHLGFYAIGVLAPALRNRLA